MKSKSHNKILKKNFLFVSIGLISLLLISWLFLQNKSAHPKDFTTTSNSSYLYQSTENNFKIELGNRLEPKKPKARFSINDTQFIEIEAENLTAIKTNITPEGVYKYEQISPDTHLTYQKTTNGLKEDIILDKPPENENLSYSFLISFPQNINLIERDTNEFAFYDQNDQYLFHLPKPFMIDQQQTKTYAVTATIEPIQSSTNLQTYRYTLTPDIDWLKDNSRQYPIIIDPTIITDGGAEPVGFWKLDEGVGSTVYDFSGNNFTGNLALGESSPSWINGKIGNGLSFDSNDYVTINENGNTSLRVASKNITVEAWIKRTSGTGAWRTILEKGTSTDLEYWFGFNSSDNLDFCLNPGDQDYSDRFYVVGNSTITDTNWHHVVATYDGTDVRLYIDGLLDNTPSSHTEDIYTSSAPLNFGRSQRFGSSVNFIGYIDHVKIYNYARTQRQIANDYSGGAPIAHWRFNEGSGTTANNSGTGGTALNGTLGTGNSAPTWTSGKFGNALSFDGINDYVSTNNINAGNQFTISAWINTNSISGSRHIFRHRKSFRDLYFEIYNDKSNLCFYDTSSNLHCVTSQNSITTSNWFHLIGSYDGSTMKLYINGIQDPNTTSGSWTPDWTSPLAQSIGGNPYDNMSWFNGLIDETKLYNYALTASEVKKEYNQGMAVQLGQPKATGSSAPIAFYKFDENYGTTTNNVGTGGSVLNGTLATGNSAPTWTTAGKISNALSFDGNDYITITSTNGLSQFSDPQTTFTLEAWIKTSATDKVIYSNTTEDGWHSIDTYNGKATMLIRNTAWGGTRVESNVLVNDGNWHHIVGVFNNPNMYIYVDGVLSGSSTFSGSLLSAGGFGGGGTRIGVYYLPDGGYFEGLIDHVKIFNYALTTSEVKIEYNQGMAVVMGNPKDILDGGTAPVAYWKLDEGTGSTTYDTSGNNNHATFGTGNSAPTWTSGKIGNALSFDGINDYTRTGGTFSSLGSTNIPYSFTGWFKTTTGETDGNIIHMSSQEPGTGWCLPPVALDNSKLTGISWDGAQVTATGNTTIQANTWYHFAVTWDSTSGLLVYLNGKLDGSTVQNTYSASGTSNYLHFGFSPGSCSGNQGFFSGQIDHVKVYNYARSARQIAMDYSGGAPIAHWKFDENTGSTANNSGTSGTALNGTLGTGNSSPSWVSGKLGKALRFTSANQFVSAPPALGNIGTADFTISTWVKEENLQAGEKMPVVYRQANTNDNPSITIQRDIRPSWNMEHIYFQIRITDPNYDLVSCGRYSGSGTPLNWSDDGKWHHIVATRNSTLGKIQIFIDGKLCNQANSTPRNVDVSSYDTYIGNYYGKAQAWDGSIDDFKIYNYALTASEVKIEYNSGTLHFR